MDKLRQFIKTLHLTPNLKLFGVGYVLGRVCKIGELFATDTTLYIALVATNGITNANTNFKKITLSNI